MMSEVLDVSLELFVVKALSLGLVAGVVHAKLCA
jgi:hypothetical protein